MIVDPEATLAYNATPAFALSFPSGTLAGNIYIAYYDPTNPNIGWNVISGPAQPSGSNVNIPTQSLPFSMQFASNHQYVFAVVETASPLPTHTITEFPLPTSSAGPSAITTGPDGNLWFTEETADQIGRITTAGAITEFPIPTANSQPRGITSGPDGNLWFVEPYSDKVGRITPSGGITEFRLPSTAGGWGPVAITNGPDGNLWVTESGTPGIARVTPAGTVTEFSLPITAWPSIGGMGIVAGSDGNLWFTAQSVSASSGEIGRITPSGALTEFPLPADAFNPWSITSGPGGDLWFTEYGGGSIGQITTSGMITEFPVRNHAPLFGITYGPDGNIWFTENATAGVVDRITPTGLITPFYLPGPSGIAPWYMTKGPDGSVWFTEYGGNAIGRIVP